MSFVTAIPTAIKVAGMLSEGYKFVQEHPDEIKYAIDEASKALSAAQGLVGNAKDLVKADEAFEKARTAALVAANAVTGKKSETPEEEAARKAEHEAHKALLRTRQAVLEAADSKSSVAKLGDRLTSKDDAVVAKTLKLLDESGCFVIATYHKLDIDTDLTDYTGVYVGKSECVGDGLARAISRGGNPDVYADIKFKQNVVVYIFGCDPQDLDDTYDALVKVMGAKESYNMPVKE